MEQKRPGATFAKMNNLTFGDPKTSLGHQMLIFLQELLPTTFHGHIYFGHLSTDKLYSAKHNQRGEFKITGISMVT